MRLGKVANGHRLSQKVVMALMGWMSGAGTPDVIRTLMYRSEFFGKPYSAWLHELMRGASAWNVGERELFAAFTSHKNACQFCIVGHSAASAQALGDVNLVDAVLVDWQTAPVDDKLKVTLGLLEKLTLEPDAVTEEDIKWVRDAGLDDGAIEEAIQICALFNIINRLADAFDFDTTLSLQPQAVAKGAAALLKFGYRI